MRYSKDHKSQTRQRIVELAGQRFRCEGLDAVGIASLMESAGLTHGGFYAHFPNKDALVAESCKSVFDQRLAKFMSVIDSVEPGQKLQVLAARYLSLSHRDHPEQGCFVASLAAEIARKPGVVQETLSERLALMTEWVEKCALADGSQTSGAAIIALLVGALTLARSVSDPQLSETYLRAGRDAVAALSKQGSP